MKPNDPQIIRRKQSLQSRFLSFFLGIFFQLLYHQFAWTYDWVAAFVSFGKWEKWTLSVLPYLKGPKILEVGHGPGHLLSALYATDIKTVGLDESSQMNKQAYRRLVKKGFSPQLINGLAQALPFPDLEFNQMVATFPSEYIYAAQTLTEIYRVLMPGGELLVLPVAWITGSKWYDRFAANLFRVTGQSPSSCTPSLIKKFISPLQATGFATQAEILELENSQLLLLHAIKPETKSFGNPSP